MQVAFIALVFTTVVICVSSESKKARACLKALADGDTAKVPLPPLPEQFTLSMKAFIEDLVKNETKTFEYTEATDLKEKLKRTGLQVEYGDVTRKWVINVTSNDAGFNLIGSTTCEHFASWSNATEEQSNPLQFIKALKGAYDLAYPRSLGDIITMAHDKAQTVVGPVNALNFMNSNFNMYRSCVPLVNHSDEDAAEKPDHFLEIDLYYLNKTVEGYTDTVGKSVPYHITVKYYAAKPEEAADKKGNHSHINGTAVLNQALYSLGQASAPPMFQYMYFLPPCGNPCSGLVAPQPAPKVPPQIQLVLKTSYGMKPESFSTKVTLDSVNRLAIFEGVADPKDQFMYTLTDGVAGRTTVVHDFQHGMIYHLKTGQKEKGCVVRHMTTDSTKYPDVVAATTAKGERHIDMKDISHFLYDDFKPEDFVFSGKKQIHTTSIPADMWIAKRKVKPSTGDAYWHTAEIYYTDMKMEDDITYAGKAVNPQFNAIRIFDLDKPKMHPEERQTTFVPYEITFQDVVDSYPWQHLDLAECLDTVPNGSLAVTVDIPAGTKINAYLPAVRAKLAELAKVSPLRIADVRVSVEPNDKPGVFFTILQAYTAAKKPYPVVNQTAEITVLQAVTNLNTTIAKGDVSINVDGTTLKVMKASLLNETSFYASPKTKTIIKKKGGYTGGNMAVLAIFMLLIGGVVGAGVYYWRMGRNNGFSYQVQA